MAAYQQSPQDEGYSEDPLTVGALSGPMDIIQSSATLQTMTASERTGMLAQASSTERTLC